MIVPAIAAAAALYQGEQNRKDSAANRDMIQRQMDAINSIPLPVLKEYYPDLYKQVVSLNPDLETATQMGPSALEGISVDPRLREAQMNALARLEEIGAGGGMTAQDRLKLAQIRDEQTADLRGATGAIEQQMAARGLSGGVSELVSKQIAAQSAANRAAQEGMNLKAQAEQRALDAIMQSGQLGGQIRGQEFGEQERVAQAKDLINKFNTQALADAKTRNVAARNQAQAWNAQTAQNTANMNVEGRNQAQQYNLNIPQQQYSNQIARVGQQVPIMNSQLQNQIAGQQSRNQLIGGLAQAAAQYYGGSGSDQKKVRNDF